MVVARDPHRSKELNVHRPHAVVVRFVTALARVEVLAMIPVLFVDRPALRATLRGIFRRNLENFGLVFASLVAQKLLQLVETPTSQGIILFLPTRQIRLFEADACEIFEHKQSILAIFSNECLRDLMVHIGYPTVLSSGNGFEFALIKLYHILC